MLLSFRFANHRSFRDEQQLNLTPVYETGIAPDAGGGLEAVPVAGIFGANASGKSNVISAFEYLRQLVGTSDQESEPGRALQRRPFRLDPEIAAEPSSYAADLMVEGVRHTYGCMLDDDRVLEEWLYTYPQKKKRVIFERSDLSFSWGERSSRSSIKKLADIVAPTALFLSVAARFEARRSANAQQDETSASLHSTFQSLYQQIRISRPDRWSAAWYARRLADQKLRLSLVDLLRAADVGLLDVLVSAPDGDSQADLKRDHAARASLADRRWDRVQFLHRGAASDALLDIDDESSGTLRFLQVASSAISVLDRGSLLLVDEIDASLHPLLTATIVRLFQSSGANPRGAQLVFTTHDATLLGSIDGDEILRRDQVWFTSKDDDGVSQLFPLAEFKPRRQGENRQKRYLNGSYGAIPELSMRLFEQAVAARTDTDAE
jgi:uncharacterized protein